VDWLRRIRRLPLREANREEPEEASPAPVERSSPGVAALFRDLKEDGSHAVLDLGSASEPSFSLYSRYARVIRFAGILTGSRIDPGASFTAESLGPAPHRPYDLVLAWNVLDRLPPKARPLLVKRIAALSDPTARLYVVVDASEDPLPYPTRFTLLGVDKVREEVTGPAEAPQPQLLPAEVERLLDPFKIVQAFTLRRGLREYVAFRKGGIRREAHWWTG